METGGLFPSLEAIVKPVKVIIDEVHSRSFFRLVEKDIPSEIVATTTLPEYSSHRKKSFRGWYIAGLSVFGIVMSLLCLRYYDITQKSSRDKNFRYEWSVNNDKLSVYHKQTGELVSISYDKNYDYNFEKLEVYFQGVRMEEFIDENEDGWFEVIKLFDKKGNLVSKNSDTNGDSLHDRIEFTLENGEKYLFVDNNQNGIYERIQSK
ncbi:MAG: hypothetical protein ACFB0B_00605 [Thermonemataceae bacterium]